MPADSPTDRELEALKVLWERGEATVRDTGVPIAIAHGDLDPLIPYENGVRLAEELGIDLVTYEGVGHVLECEVPDEMAVEFDPADVVVLAD